MSVLSILSFSSLGTVPMGHSAKQKLRADFPSEYVIFLRSAPLKEF